MVPSHPPCVCLLDRVSVSLSQHGVNCALDQMIQEDEATGLSTSTPPLETFWTSVETHLGGGIDLMDAVDSVRGNVATSRYER